MLLYNNKLMNFPLPFLVLGQPVSQLNLAPVRDHQVVIVVNVIGGGCKWASTHTYIRTYYQMNAESEGPKSAMAAGSSTTSTATPTPTISHSVRIEEDSAKASHSGSSSPSTQSHRMDIASRRRQFMSQPSTVATRRQQAVCVRRACKNYGPKKNPNVILDSLNMTVPKGTM